MSLTESYIAHLVLKKIGNTLTEEEATELETWKAASAEHAEIFEHLVNAHTLKDDLYTWLNIQQKAENISVPIIADTAKHIMSPLAHRLAYLRRNWGWVAASILLVFGTVVYNWLATKNNVATEPIGMAKAPQDITPGKEGAILTLADGSQVVLDSLSDGLIATQNGSQVLLKNGQIAYTTNGTASSEMVYNTMTTPKGRQFQLTLPDGTQIWLNAASSIRYPTVFSGQERKVLITGEAYFEVAQNAKMPFRVNINNKAEINVLGTSFNINAYDNEESLNTTLLEGAVSVRVLSADLNAKVAAGIPPNKSTIIQPGQQAQLPAISAAAEDPLHQVRVVQVEDMDKVMAWKNGLFNFNGVALKEVMRQLERWYDIEVVYQSTIPAIKFWGKMTKDVSLDGLMLVLKKAEVNYKLEGRKLIIYP